jgi:citrate/tricarballylate utilization protein
LLVSLITVLSVAVIVLLAFIFQGPEVVLATHLGENAFYKVIPYGLMVVPFSALGIYILINLLMTGIKFWHETGGQLGELIDLRANSQAIKDVLQLKYLDGGGHGCNYPNDRFSMIRRWFHHGVFYGFLLCFSSTAIAAIYDHFLHLSAPYPILSWPVMLGTFGGLALLFGSGGLLFLKRKMDPLPATHRALGMDVAFTVLLFLTSLTGLLLLILRETAAMGTLLAVHLGVVAGLFITLPIVTLPWFEMRSNIRAGEVNSNISSFESVALIQDRRKRADASRLDFQNECRRFWFLDPRQRRSECR